VQQQNSGAVEDFILPHSAVHLRIQKWKNYWNRSTFAKVIVKNKSGTFFNGPRCSNVTDSQLCQHYLVTIFWLYILLFSKMGYQDGSFQKFWYYV